MTTKVFMYKAKALAERVTRDGIPPTLNAHDVAKTLAFAFLANSTVLDKIQRAVDEAISYGPMELISENPDTAEGRAFNKGVDALSTRVASLIEGSGDPSREEEFAGEGVDLGLLRKLALGEGGRRTGALARAGLLEWRVTEKGMRALGFAFEKPKLREDAYGLFAGWSDELEAARPRSGEPILDNYARGFRHAIYFAQGRLRALLRDDSGNEES